MATWIAHLRVAENILDEGFKFDKVPFVVGNIGPDARMPNEDWSQFSPPTEVTHWKTDKTIEPEKFWDKYLKNLNAEDNFERYPEGYCLLEKRMMDVALRHGVNEYTVPKWKEIFKIQKYFENKIGRPIYSVLPGVVENTFGIKR